MKKGLTLLAVLMLMAAAACQQEPPPFWFEGTTFDAAQVQARTEGKMILIDFYSPT